MDYLQRFLSFRLFVIGNNEITVNHLVLFLLAVLATYLLARTVRRVLNAYLLTTVEPAQRYVLVRVSQYFVWFAGLLVGLQLLNVDLSSLALIAGALGIGIGFGLQSVVANFVSGVLLLIEQPVRYRDRVTVADVEGQVESINFRATTIITNDNISIIVPNSQLVNNPVINWSHGDPRIRIHVPVGVAYGSDVELVTETLFQVAGAEEKVLRQPEPEVRFREFGDSSLNFELLVWTDDPPNYHRLQSRLNYAIDAAFRSQGIQIPFPQRDLHIRSGVPEDSVGKKP